MIIKRNDKQNIAFTTFLKKAGEQAGKVVIEDLKALAKDGLNAVNEQEVIEKLKADPEAVKAVSKAVEAQWYTLTQEVGGGVDAARKADAAFTSGEARFWHSPAFWITAMLLPLVYIATYAVLLKGGFSSDIQAMVLGAIFGGLLTGGISAFWFGTQCFFSTQDRNHVSPIIHPWLVHISRSTSWQLLFKTILPRSITSMSSCR